MTAEPTAKKQKLDSPQKKELAISKRRQGKIIKETANKLPKPKIILANDIPWFVCSVTGDLLKEAYQLPLLSKNKVKLVGCFSSLEAGIWYFNNKCISSEKDLLEINTQIQESVVQLGGPPNVNAADFALITNGGGLPRKAPALHATTNYSGVLNAQAEFDKYSQKKSEPRKKKGSNFKIFELNWDEGDDWREFKMPASEGDSVFFAVPTDMNDNTEISDLAVKIIDDRRNNVSFTFSDQTRILMIAKDIQSIKKASEAVVDFDENVGEPEAVVV